jgi:hypothetical protein
MKGGREDGARDGHLSLPLQSSAKYQYIRFGELGPAYTKCEKTGQVDTEKMTRIV